MQRYFAQAKQEEYFILQDSDYHHILTVMRMQNHDQIEVVLNKKLYLCEILKDGKTVKVKMLNECKEEKHNKQKIHLILPLLKEQKMDFILQKATELGVEKISWLETERSIVKLDQNKFQHKKERWEKIVKEASEQSKRTTIPTLLNLNKIPDLQKLDGIKFICSTQEKENSVKKALKKYNSCDTMNIVIGPEGGLSITEENKLRNIGFEPITLGENIMRVETVPIFILSVVNYEYME